jgi:hypothetical protein
VKSSKTSTVGFSAGYAGAFGGFDGRIWLNAAHQGPLPRLATEAAEAALAAKLAPHRISDEAFVEVPRWLRALLGRLIGAPPEESNETVCQRLTDAGIDAALRAGNIRLSPHLYNTPGQIQHAAAILAGATATPGTWKRRE